jgi:Uma2 family endonuclease
MAGGTIVRIDGPDGPVEMEADDLQGLWTEEQYLRLRARAGGLMEYIDGRIEVLSMPTTIHQVILVWLMDALWAAAGPAALVLPAPLPLRLPSGNYREPDILLVRDAADPRVGQAAWHGADLVAEVISPSGARRDLVDKRADYAAAAVREYWVADPAAETLLILRLAGDAYEGTVYGRGQTAHSALFPDLAVSVTALYDAAARVRREA